jgi:hypothetical protein
MTNLIHAPLHIELDQRVIIQSTEDTSFFYGHVSEVCEAHVRVRGVKPAQDLFFDELGKGIRDQAGCFVLVRCPPELRQTQRQFNERRLRRVFQSIGDLPDSALARMVESLGEDHSPETSA